MSRFSAGLFVVLALAGTTLAGDIREDENVEEAAFYRCDSLSKSPPSCTIRWLKLYGGTVYRVSICETFWWQRGWQKARAGLWMWTYADYCIAPLVPPCTVAMHGYRSGKNGAPGKDQVFVVPEGVSKIEVKLWASVAA